MPLRESLIVKKITGLFIIYLLAQMPVVFAYDIRGERFIISSNTFYISTVSGPNGEFLAATYSDGTIIQDEDLMFQLFEMNAALETSEYITKQKLLAEITPERLLLLLKELEIAGKITDGFSVLLRKLDINNHDLQLNEAKDKIEKGKTITKNVLGITELQHWALVFQEKRDWESCKNFEAALGRLTAEALIAIGIAKAASSLVEGKRSITYESISSTVIGILPPPLAERVEVSKGMKILGGILQYTPFDSINVFIKSAERGLTLLFFSTKAKFELENSKKNLLGAEHYFERERGFVSRILEFLKSLVPFKIKERLKHERLQ